MGSTTNDLGIRVGTVMPTVPLGSEPMASMSEIEGIEIPTSSGTNQNLGKSMAYRTPEQTKTNRVVMGIGAELFRRQAARPVRATKCHQRQSATLKAIKSGVSHAERPQPHPHQIQEPRNRPRLRQASPTVAQAQIHSTNVAIADQPFSFIVILHTRRRFCKT